MKKALVIGDVHGRDTWVTLLERHFDSVDQVIFVGDYVDSYDIKDIRIVDNLNKIIQVKNQYTEKVELLIGNHDAQYMWINNFQFRCSGYNENLSTLLHKTFYDNKDLFKFAVQLDDTVVSHAGISESWLKRFNAILAPYSIEVDMTNLVHVLNMCVAGRVSIEALNCIGQVGKSRGGDFATGGPIWADKSDLMRDYLRGIGQIVGHTPQWNNEPFFFVTDYKDMKIRFIDISNGALEHPCIVEYKNIIK